MEAQGDVECRSTAYVVFMTLQIVGITNILDGEGPCSLVRKSFPALLYFAYKNFRVSHRLTAKPFLDVILQAV